MYPIEYFTLDAKDIVLDKGELKRRLQVSKDFDVAVFETCIQKVLEASAPKCCYTKVPVSVHDNGRVDLGFVTVESKDLAKNIGDCKEAYVFAVTIGIGVDRLLSRLSLLSPSEFFICDAVGSALAESVCDVAEDMIKKNTPCRPRFSPGYGDLDISVQKDVLSVLNAEKLLGITLTDGFLMMPQKSITAILAVNGVGMQNEE